MVTEVIIQEKVFAKMRAGDLVNMGYRSMIISYRNDRGLPKDPSESINMALLNGEILMLR